jgi:enoyl-CoA hydratase/carnithine racemase
MWLSIAEHCQALARHPAVRLLVVRGEGEHFCAGADIAGLAGADPRAYHRANAAADEALASFPKPTVAVVTGSCVGGGTELAVACDVRIADTTARFGITPARLGIVYPAHAVVRVVRLIGPSAAKHLLYSAELIDAERSLRVGLIDELHPPGQLADRVAELTDRLARRRSLLTQMASKEMVDAAAEHGAVPAEVSTRWARTLAASGERAEGIASFLERRDPSFTWTPDQPGPAAR